MGGPMVIVAAEVSAKAPPASVAAYVLGTQTDVRAMTATERRLEIDGAAVRANNLSPLAPSLNKEGE